MFTGVFKTSSAKPLPACLAREKLARLLASKAFREYRFIPQGQIGPFVVDYLCPEAGLIIELPSRTRVSDSAQRTAFLSQMGYRVLRIESKDLAHLHRAVRQIQAALKS